MVKPAIHGATELEVNKVFKNNKPVRHQRMDKDKKIAIAEYIIDYVKRNPGKQIPNAKIADKCNTAAHNIGTITKELVKLGEISHVTRYTYKVNERPTKLPPVQEQLIPQQFPKHNIASDVEQLAKDYMWQENGSGTLKGFIDWLKDQ